MLEGMLKLENCSHFPLTGTRPKTRETTEPTVAVHSWQLVPRSPTPPGPGGCYVAGRAWDNPCAQALPNSCTKLQHEAGNVHTGNVYA